MISITVSIHYAPSTWRYDYTYASTGGMKTIPCRYDENCGAHTLGTPAELGLVGDHAWEVKFANTGDQPEPYRVEITWMQGGQRLCTWSCDGNVEQGDFAIVSGSAVLVYRSAVAVGHCTDDWTCHD